MDLTAYPRIAIVIPARNEARVIAEKIHSTHRMHFPPLPIGITHLAIVVDDESSDATLDIAKETVDLLQKRSNLEWRIIKNQFSPGKGGALRTGFGEGAGFDIFVITDADAIVSENAPVSTAGAMRRANVGVASGMQRYAAVLQNGIPGGDRRDLYDIASEEIRALESRFGILFSVHGPWLAFRSAAGAEPREGIAADDLDLSLQIRERGWRAILLRDVIFYEWKPGGELLEAQRIRRARAYFEVMDLHWRNCLQIRPRPFGAAQFVLYAFGPVLLAILFCALWIAPPILTFIDTGNLVITLAVMLAEAGIFVLPPVYQCYQYAMVILKARFSPPRRAADRWTPTARPL
ncbi:MAG: glycosyltransferase [Planctomycetota bacterium]